MPENDLPQHDETVVTPPTPPAGQSENWEARFKGMQSAYNDLKTKYDAQVTHGASLQTKVTELTSQMASTTTQSQAEVTRLSSELEIAKNQAATLQSDLQAKASKIEELGRDKEVRAVISSEFPELMSWYDGGFVSVGDKQGDDLKTFLSQKRDFIQNRTGQEIDEKLRGGSPVVQPAGAGLDSLSVEQLSDRLMEMDPRDANWTLYSDALAKKAVVKN